MAAVSRGARSVPGNLVIEILPGKGDQPAELDVTLFTSMGQARNMINVLSAKVVVVSDGGDGDGERGGVLRVDCVNAGKKHLNPRG